VASLALVKAVDGFDPSRDTAFSSYAVPSIEGAIKRHFRDYGWSLRMPRELQELALRVERVSEELSGPTQHDLTQTEIGRHLDYSQMHVSRLLRHAITQLAKTPETAKHEPMQRPDRTLAVGRAIEALPASIRYLTNRQTALDTSRTLHSG
jgi:RNA polymerase sigma-B factor